MKQKGSSDVKGSSWNHLDKRLFYGIVKYVYFIFEVRVLYESEFLIVMEEFVLTTMNSLTTHLQKGYLSASM